MEIEQVSQLAKILRENGHHILNSKGKLSLSIGLLHGLNNFFSQVIERDLTASGSFQFTPNTADRNELLRDLQFLYHFVQKSVSLKLTSSLIKNGEESVECVDVSKFKSVRFLELNQVSPKSIRGIQSLKAELQFLTCVRRSIDTLGEILETCGADESDGFTWCNLKEATFSYNELTKVDRSLEFVPWLHVLDLSHNKLRDASAISCLPNLKNLNLSYNHLEAVPNFNGQLCSRLQVLILSNNFIDDLKELTVLINLIELELSNNCLVDHEVLGSISYLAALQWLNLERNPICFHPQHRLRTARFLHSNTKTVRFLLDRTMLNQAEKNLVGLLHPIHSALYRSRLSSSFCSTTSENTMVHSDRPKRIRNAVILDSVEDEIMNNSTASLASLITSSEHLETKQKIEQIRREYGENWLLSLGGGTDVQDTLGFDKSATCSSSPYEKEFLLHAAEINFERNEKPQAEVVSEQSVFLTADESLETEPEDTSLYAEKRVTTPEQQSISDDEYLGDGDENIYLAYLKNDPEPVFIILTDTHIKERESGTGKERMRWDLDGLLSCELLGDDCTEVKLCFDTLNRDKKERLYVLEVNEATRLSCVLKNILTNRPLEKSKLTLYKCLKCSTQFSHEKLSGQKTTSLQCPICSSTLVIKDD